MMKLGNLQVDLEVNTKELDNAEKKVKKSTDRMTNSFKGLGTAIAGVFTAQQVINVIKTADQMRVLEGRIRRVTSSAQDFEKAWKAINDSADSAGISIAESASSFERFLTATKGMGASVDQVAEFNDLILKTGVISGSTSEELSNALTQLSQSFQGGIIRAEEWNSIIEQSPEILRVAARNIDGVNGDLGKLREMMLDGQLTADKFFNAFMMGAEDIRTEFAKVPKSLTQGMQAINNEFVRMITNMDKTWQVTEKMSTALGFWADFLDSDANKLKDLNAELHETNKEIRSLQALQSEAFMVGDLDAVEDINRELNPLIDKAKTLFNEIQKVNSASGSGGGAVDLLVSPTIAKEDTSGADYLAKIEADTASAMERITLWWEGHFTKLQELRDSDKISEQEYLEAINQLNEEAVRRQDALAKDSVDAQIQQMEGLAAIGTSLGQLMDSIGSGSSNLSKAANAFHAFATTMIATSQALAAAQALADPTALTLPQKLMNYATIISSFAAIGGMLAGGRVNGGGMRQGSMYAINENGSEILNEGGKQYLLAGKNASITSQSAMTEVSGGGAGGGMMVNNVFNITGTDDELNRKLEASVNRAVKAAESNYINQMTNKNGKMFKANQQTYGSGKTTGRVQ